MQDRRRRVRFFDYLLDRPMPLAGTLAILVAVIEAAVDWTTWVELDVSAVYGIPLVLAAVARNRRLLWVLAACLVFMTFAAYAAQIGRGVFSLGEPYFINRAMSAAALTLSAALCHVWIVAANRLAAQGRSLIEQNQELDRLRRIAEEASSRKTQLLASVSHDIRTPLTTIDLIADLILRSADNPALAAQLPDLVKRLRRNTLSLADLVSALVDISSLDAGRISVRNSEFSLNELLLEECERLSPLAQAKGLRLATEAPEPPVRLLTDRVKLTRVLSNLVGNAIKFTETGGVTVTATLTAERSLLMRVSDTGVGMLRQNLARIFDEYGQLGNPERDGNKGWGLGLAICRRLIGVMGGEITVESEPGRGTTFSVHLPPSCVVDHVRSSGAAIAT
jgi:signal transduction histidine kinase